MVHTPTITLVRTAPEEMAAVAILIAARLTAARGRAGFILPEQSFGWFSRPGQPLYDPEADQVFRREFKAHVHPQVEVVEVAAHLNDPQVGEIAIKMMKAFREVSKKVN